MSAAVECVVSIVDKDRKCLLVQIRESKERCRTIMLNALFLSFLTAGTVTKE